MSMKCFGLGGEYAIGITKQIGVKEFVSLSPTSSDLEICSVQMRLGYKLSACVCFMSA